MVLFTFVASPSDGLTVTNKNCPQAFYPFIVALRRKFHLSFWIRLPWNVDGEAAENCNENHRFFLISIEVYRSNVDGGFETRAPPMRSKCSLLVKLRYGDGGCEQHLRTAMFYGKRWMVSRSTMAHAVELNVVYGSAASRVCVWLQQCYVCCCCFFFGQFQGMNLMSTLLILISDC